MATIKKISCVTSTRADFYLLEPTLKKIQSDVNIKLELIVTGSHLMSDYGSTIDEIQPNFEIKKKIPMHYYSDSSSGITSYMAFELKEFSDLFAESTPDALLILGDRFEILIPVIAATIFKIPVFHMCGGDITEGAYDQTIRNIISSAALIHFPTNELAAENIRRSITGEENKAVVTVAGHPGLETLLSMETLPERDLLTFLRHYHPHFSFEEHNLLIIFHPETMLETIKPSIEIFINLIYWLASLNKVNIILMGTNIDTDNHYIIEKYREISELKNVYYFANLNQKLFFQLAKKCCMYIGNSSSGIYELPYLIKTIINVGNRQLGRLLASNIVSVAFNLNQLKSVITDRLQNSKKETHNEPVSYQYLAYETSDIIYQQIRKHFFG